MAQARISNRFVVALLLAATYLRAAAAEPEVKAGGVSLKLPGPASDFAEVGDKLRTTFFALLAPSSNRLLTAYVPAQALERLNANASGGLDFYALVEVSRRAEHTDLTS